MCLRKCPLRDYYGSICVEYIQSESHAVVCVAREKGEPNHNIVWHIHTALCRRSDNAECITMNNYFHSLCAPVSWTWWWQCAAAVGS